MKKKLLFAVAMLMCFMQGFASIPSFYSGMCGNDLTWTLDISTGVLTISGTGTMTSYSDATPSEWYSHRIYVKDVVIGNEVTSIGSCALSGCNNLTSVAIPNSVTSIGLRAFSGCSKLASIVVDNSHPSFVSENGVLFNKQKTILICYPDGKQGDSYTIPNSVTNIKSYAFSANNGITKLTIPNSVTTIESNAVDVHLIITKISAAPPIFPPDVPPGSTGNDTTSKIKEINVYWENPLPVSVSSFIDANKKCILNVPIGTEEKYRAADVWKNFDIRMSTAVQLPIATQGKLTCYPNPAKDYATICYEVAETAVVSPAVVRICDMQGRLVKSISIRNSKAGINKENIDTSALSKGTYIIVVSAAGKENRALLIKE